MQSNLPEKSSSFGQSVASRRQEIHFPSRQRASAEDLSDSKDLQENVFHEKQRLFDYEIIV